MKKGLISFISGIVGAVVGAGTISKIMGRSLANKKNMSVGEVVRLALEKLIHK